MSITGSLYTAESGLLSHGNSLSVIGNNVSNYNTVGFKASRPEFAEILSDQVSDSETGKGVQLACASPLFSQGALETTRNVTDLAIQGAGLFVVQAPDGSNLYTRAGDFTLDNNRALVNHEGLSLQGFSAGEAGTTSGTLESIILDESVTLPPQATTSMSVAVNLDARVAVHTGGWPGEQGDAASHKDWLSASQSSTMGTVYDSQGEARDLTFLFRRTDTNRWEYRVVTPVPGSQDDPNNTSNSTAVGAGILSFNVDGTLNEDGSVVGGDSVTGLVAGTDDLTLLANSLSFAGSTQIAGSSGLSAFVQDGSPIGVFTDITIDSRGIVNGKFSNGRALPLYQIALANFPSEEKLNALGNTLFAESIDSGVASIGSPGTEGLGSVISGGLERSTVDISREFVSLITSQRAFQVNSRVITVADQMYDIAADLKQ